ncbi:MAG: hypothetical protein ACHQEB_01855 [Chitinophagales bacterium]
MNEKAIEQEVECLNGILQFAELPHQFCIAHELVDRNQITSKAYKILKAIRNTELESFRFLIGKN